MCVRHVSSCLKSPALYARFLGTKYVPTLVFILTSPLTLALSREGRGNLNKEGVLLNARLFVLLLLLSLRLLQH